jgi:hypothetical protein
MNKRTSYLTNNEGESAYLRSSWKYKQNIPKTNKLNETKPFYEKETTLKVPSQIPRMYQEDYDDFLTMKKSIGSPNKKTFVSILQLKKDIKPFQFESFSKNDNFSKNFDDSKKIENNDKKLNFDMFTDFKSRINKEEYTDNLNSESLNSIKMNLQKVFTNNLGSGNSIFDSKTHYKSERHTLISSEENSKQTLKPVSPIRFSQATVNDSLIDNFNNKTNILIPHDKVDNEYYKLLAVKKLKKPSFKDNKSTTRRPLFKADQDENSRIQEQELINNLFNGKRKKVIHSQKRTYASHIQFTDPMNGDKKNFQLFKDADIGFNVNWQKYLQESKADEDVPSDDELIIQANKFSLMELKESFKLVKEEYHQVHNIIYL